jgi:DNA-binding CsgD family transcriptional regulator
MIILKNIQSQTVIKSQNYKSFSQQNVHKSSFFEEVVEGFQDGILIVTDSGQLVFANSSAWRFCQQINKHHDHEDSDISSDISACDRNVPSVIWKICQPLVENSSFCHQNIVLSDEIILNNSAILRVRVRWLNLDQFNYPSLLITIENRDESIKNTVLIEVKKYKLTRREAEIWYLYRSNYSYKKIAVQLFITVNTVKKHMKNIYAKRQDFSESNAD